MEEHKEWPYNEKTERTLRRKLYKLLLKIKRLAHKPKNQGRIAHEEYQTKTTENLTEILVKLTAETGKMKTYEDVIMP